MPRALGIRIVGTEQNPDALGLNDEAVRRRCDVTLSKMHFDACSDGLAELLTESCAPGDRPEVVIAGCEAHVCLMQTALGLLERGFRTWVVETACGSRRAADKQAAMQRLREAGATVVSDEMVLFEWVRHGVVGLSVHVWTRRLPSGRLFASRSSFGTEAHHGSRRPGNRSGQAGIPTAWS
jgi:hypothetical protein